MTHFRSSALLTGTVTDVRGRLVGQRRFPATDITLRVRGVPVTTTVFGSYGQRLTDGLQPGETLHVQGRLYQTGPRDAPATLTVITGSRVHPGGEMNAAHVSGHLTAAPTFTGAGDALRAEVRLAAEDTIGGKPHTSYLRVLVTGAAAHSLQALQPRVGTCLTCAGQLATDGGLHLHADQVQVHLKVAAPTDGLYDAPQPDSPF